MASLVNQEKQLGSEICPCHGNRADHNGQTLIYFSLCDCLPKSWNNKRGWDL
ncbi:MAG: hypothetical protein KAJ39_10185 [Gammaproteobacteria bacterium]|nr:hypothetical protein [Gammaproteobacteria bacterium]